MDGERQVLPRWSLKLSDPSEYNTTFGPMLGLVFLQLTGFVGIHEEQRASVLIEVNVVYALRCLAGTVLPTDAKWFVHLSCRTFLWECNLGNGNMSNGQIDEPKCDWLEDHELLKQFFQIQGLRRSIPRKKRPVDWVDLGRFCFFSSSRVTQNIDMLARVNEA
eukprot:scaffold13478_cov132-Cylindrotheca_fusiformis.AAC.25